jgi:hypothetical protein
MKVSDVLSIGNRVECFRNRMTGIIRNVTTRINRPVYQVFFPATGLVDWFYRDDLDIVRTLKDAA